ncbi:hypothetical protein NBO_1486g0001 [Nosema bombycis CQ1]|uniref:Uncharacterized protein n=1 Tax=Nosema bombycis (strain CQ1 / CVCC 102059) TaxID=578461 RepID=R0MEH5_NOSB1|nr:hypothetical protein NBO_1486g0001 [Nosema bombycis CQ1]|eukprot:EOB11188.1 hypothetical protein NBO_1486g0001 [Nosema bombycis CQ1]
MAYSVVYLFVNYKYLTIYATDMHLNIEQYHFIVEPVNSTSIQMNNIIVANQKVLTSYQTAKEQIHKKTMYLLLCFCCLFVLGGMVFSILYDPKLISLSFLGLVLGAIFIFKTAFT